MIRRRNESGIELGAENHVPYGLSYVFPLRTIFSAGVLLAYAPAPALPIMEALLEGGTDSGAGVGEGATGIDEVDARLGNIDVGRGQATMRSRCNKREKRERV